MSHPSRNSRLFLLIIAVIVVVLSCFGMWSQISTRNTAGTLRRVTIAQVGDFFLYAPLYIALDADFFRKEGLDVSIVNTGGDDKTWAAVLSGSAEFGVADPTFVAVSAVRGQNGMVVASLVNGVPFWGVTYKQIPSFKTANDVGRYSVATFPSPSTAYTLQKKMFIDAGLPPNIREGAFGAIIPMLKAGRADIGLELEPNVSQAEGEGAKIVYSLAKQYGDFAITGVTASAETVRRDPALVRSVNKAIQNALDLLHTNPSKALSLLEKRFPTVPHRVASAALERVLHDSVIPKRTTVSEEAWNKAIRLRKEVGDLKEAAPYNQFVWSADTAK